jgi:16S rRNA (adenine1518-N6/adenine1519-N6)-dimethyltransferase
MRTDSVRRPARKRFGQNFLEAVWADKVVAAIRPQSDEVFLEIGPGPGALTRRLSTQCSAVVACEIDRDLAAALRDEHLPRLNILEGDFLAMPLERLRDALVEAAPTASTYRVAGNLPYNVASPIMFRLVELARQGLPIVDATIMLQREVADRLLAGPGTREYGLLSVLIGHRATVVRLLNLPPGAFRPAPKVHSTVVSLRFHPPQPPVADESVLAGLTGAVFSQRRKTLNNALQAYALTPAAASALLVASGIDPRRRPETLATSELCCISDNFTKLQS